MKKYILLFILQGVILILESYVALFSQSSSISWFEDYPKSFPYFTMVIGMLLIIAAVGFIEKRYYGYYTALFLYLAFTVGVILQVFFSFYRGELASIFIGISAIAVIIFILKSIIELEEKFSSGNEKSIEFQSFIVLFYGASLSLNSFIRLFYIGESVIYFNDGFTFIVVFCLLIIGIVILLIAIGMFVRDTLAYSVGFIVFASISIGYFLSLLVLTSQPESFDPISWFGFLPMLLYITYYMYKKKQFHVVIKTT